MKHIIEIIKTGCTDFCLPYVEGSNNSVGFINANYDNIKLEGKVCAVTDVRTMQTVKMVHIKVIEYKDENPLTYKNKTIKPKRVKELSNVEKYKFKDNSERINFKREVINLRKEGLTLQNIADKFGKSRQRIQQIVNEYEVLTNDSQ